MTILEVITSTLIIVTCMAISVLSFSYAFFYRRMMHKKYLRIRAELRRPHPEAKRRWRDLFIVTIDYKFKGQNHIATANNVYSILPKSKAWIFVRPDSGGLKSIDTWTENNGYWFVISGFFMVLAVADWITAAIIR